MLDEIVFIDDNRVTNLSNRQLVRQFLPDIPVKIFENGEDGLRYLIEAQDAQLRTLVFLDLEMPVMNGFEFLDVYENAIAYQEHHFAICLLSDSLGDHKPQRFQHYPSVLDQLSKPLNRTRMENMIDQAVVAIGKCSKRRAL